MKHSIVQSFICASVDQAISAMGGAIKGSTFESDRKLDKTM